MTEKKLNNCTQSQPTSDTRGKKKKKENVEKCFSWARRRPSCVYRYYDVAVTAAGFRRLKSNILQPLLRKIVPCSLIKPNHWKTGFGPAFCLEIASQGRRSPVMIQKSQRPGRSEQVRQPRILRQRFMQRTHSTPSRDFCGIFFSVRVYVPLKFFRIWHGKQIA